MLKLPPPPPRPRLDSYLFDRNLDPQNGPRDTLTTENDYHRGWSVFSSSAVPGTPPCLSASVNSQRPCRPIPHPLRPAPHTSTSRRRRHHHGPPIPSPLDKAACARFRLARKKCSKSTTPSTSRAPRSTRLPIAPSFYSLLELRRAPKRMAMLANVRVRRLLSVVAHSVQRAYAVVLHHFVHCPLPLVYEARNTLPALTASRALSVAFHWFFPSRTIQHPCCQPSLPPVGPRRVYYPCPPWFAHLGLHTLHAVSGRPHLTLTNRRH